ncbi:GIY-YIG nuclease superfamily protein [uncultured Roseburia sp.]|uniref:GIY-YIG nuclease family protein n=1 Tax=Brotonthovivens ammoniilytica TaxID=2981725 RepID=A0ABT2TND2_9FIRM|nr:GIY-YIG nuclease family protein [Brotonthovivens ammoniilytica]MCU6763758.1 GIY-YIG nuclease family protein [Brotonthovivens ammoniilytica]SCJ33961.1 GIY-YIG nuclease superfamily protein [uncultured Roseburia sp.]
MNFTYMLKCKDESFYTGWTNDIQKRIKQHRQGKGAKYTRGRGPLKLVYLEFYENKEDAMKREAQIKKLTRREKERLTEKDDWKWELQKMGIQEL